MIMKKNPFTRTCLQKIRTVTEFAMLLVAFSSCSTLPELSNYVLVPAQLNHQTLGIRVSTLELAPYFDHNDVLLELADHSFHRANFHKWGEPLRKGIIRVIEHSSSTPNHVDIELKITQFHGTENGSVLLSGQWRKTQKRDTFAHQWQCFNIKNSVKSAGYAPMISSLNQLLEKLREQINDSLVSELLEID